MVYIVTVGYNTFRFKDSMTAIGYAELSKVHFTPTEYNETAEVTITIEKEDGEDA